MNKSLLAFKLVVLAWLCAANVQAIVRYVKPGSASTAWQTQTNVYPDLQAALTAAVSGDEIWMAAGTYKPTTGTDRNICFVPKEGVAIYGGFEGSETLRSQRNWSENFTVLSGEINAAGIADNSYNVIKMLGTSSNPFTSATILDGLIVQDGNAEYDGGGIYMRYASPLIVNCVFRNNNANRWGGALGSDFGGNAAFYNTIFQNNKSVGRGGAASIGSPMSFTHCLFYGNSSDGTNAMGAIFTSVMSVSVSNSIAWNNKSATITSDFSTDITCTYSCVESNFVGNGNISNDPMFVDAANGNFRLNAGSPCIDNGLSSITPSWLLTDFSGKARLAGNGIDMGPYEGGSVTPIISYPANNGVVNPNLSSVTLQWEWNAPMPVGITGYEVEMVRNGGTSSFLTSSTTSIDLLALTSATTYKWRVRGVDASTDKYWSPWSVFYIPNNHPLYVKVGGTGTGASWATAYGNLQTAIDAAFYGDEIWVAAGTYKPTTTSDRTISFSLKDGVAVYGGFNGTETLLAQRNWTKNKTVLSGDIGTVGTDTDNSYHVVTALGTEVSSIGDMTRLDGVIVEKGYADENYSPNHSGGGIYLKFASPEMTNVIICNNYAIYGGGIYSWSSTALFSNCLLLNNKSGDKGGAVYTNSAITFSHAVFYGNSAVSSGGAVYGYADANFNVTNSIAWGNSGGFYKNFYSSYAQCTYSCIENGYTGTGNISINPHWIDAVNGDFRLNVISPCIDKGSSSGTPASLSTDFGGNARLEGTTADMGAFEGGVIVPIIKSPLKNGVVSPFDASVILEWGWESTNPNGIVSYEVEIRPEGGSSSLIAATAMSLAFDGKQPATIYQWRVRGVDGSGYKNWSDWSTFVVPHNHPIYVKESGSGDGTSWNSAYGDLQTAINESFVGDSIWMAKGTYKPTSGTDRTISFSLKDGVHIYGGFAGTELKLSERNWVVNPTILSGDIGVVDTDTDNSFHVLTAVGTTTSPISQNTRVDGVIVENGYADGNSFPQNCGGGIYLNNGNPVLINLLINNNVALSGGGGAYADYSTSTFQNCQFISNRASNGGAAYTGSATSYTHCLIVNNSSTGTGSAIYGNQSFDLTNSIVWGNTSPYGALNWENLINCCIEGGYTGTDIISANPLFVDAANGDFRLLATSPCIDKGLNSATPVGLKTDYLGTARLKGSIVDMGPYEGGVIVPLTKLPLKDAIISPVATSVHIEWGWETTVPSGITGYEVEIVSNGGSSTLISTTTLSADFEGLQPATSYQWRVRGLNGSIFKDWSSWSTFAVPHNHPLYVKTDGTGDGSSWALAFGDLQAAINESFAGDSIWVAKGTYKPTSGTDRTISFSLKDGVVIYGGFAGTEVKLSERHWDINQTILSGDIGVVGIDTDNSYHVLTAIGTSESPISANTRVDGVIIENGYADGSIFPQSWGGGIYLSNGNPIICNVLIRNNYATAGGGVYAPNSTTLFQNCQFIGNKANNGGAVYTGTAISFSHCLIVNNYATYSGSAIYGNVSFDLTNSIVWGNTSSANFSTLNYANCTNCCIEKGYSGTGIVSTNPLFVDASTGDYRLLPASPCIDKGLNSSTPAGLETDFLGSARLKGTIVDIGPYEGGVIVPITKLPLNNGVVSPDATSVHIEWGWETTVPSVITGYEVEIVANGVSSSLISATTMSTDFEGLQPATLYQWRVRGIDGSIYKDWSSWSTFAVPHIHPLYVKTDGTGDGSSWALAFGDLQTAISKSFAGDSIWVAKGTYKPTAGTDRTISFSLKDGVVIYGGFAGNELKLSERNWVNNPTILSGDIGATDTETDNSFHVLAAVGTSDSPISANTRVDGVIIENGYADDVNFSHNRGGGVYLNGGNPVMCNVLIRNNYTIGDGGGVFAQNSTTSFHNCQFIGNKANYGGAAYTISATSFIHCLIVNNYATRSGSAIYGETSFDLTNSIVWGNTSSANYSTFNYANCNYCCIEGGYSGTGIISTDPLFVDVSAGDYRLMAASPCIDKGLNSSTPAGLETDFLGSARLKGTIVDIGPYEGGVIVPITKAPLKNGVVSPDAASVKLEWGWETAVPGDITGYEVEIVANGGSSSLISATTMSTDFEGLQPATSYQWRVRSIGVSIDKDWSSWSTFVVPHNHPIYVKEGGSGNGTSWAMAYGDLQLAINKALYGDSIWMAKGTYKPTAGTDRTISFCLKDGVAIYGGFAGNELKLSERNWVNNPTILSGDIGVADIDTDNSYHVLSAVGTATLPISHNTRVDGVIIEKGNANGSNYQEKHGGGIFLENGSPVLSNLLIRNNITSNYGGGSYAYNSTSSFQNCQFIGNKAQDGGAAYTGSATSYTHCLIANNYAADSGSAIYGNVSFDLTNSIVWGNTSAYGLFNWANCTNCCIEGGYSGTNIISADPLFVDATNSDFRLLATSPCINKGDNSLTPANLLTDFSGRARLTGTVVDLGPYEGGVATPVAKLPVDKDVLLPTVKSVTLEWQWPSTMPDGITGYEIEVADESGSSDLYTSEVLTFDVTSLSSANTYQWRVRGIDGTSYKNWSEWSSFIIPHNRPLYVKAGAVGNGSSWMGAYGNLQDAINDAYPTDTIWVAAGTYKPTTDTDRTASFTLKEGVVVYGGFDGFEDALSERNWVNNPTILSGDIGVTGTNTDNSYHVVKIMGTNDVAINNCRMDGFIIEKGYGDGSDLDDCNGGAMKIYRAHPQMMNIVFRDNYVGNFGGAIYANVCSSTFTNCQFINNQSNGDGGAVYSVNTLEFVNCLFTKNQANLGAAHYGSSTCYFYNSIVWDNTSASSVIYNANCKYSCIQGGHSGTGNINADPLFADAANDNYHLTVNSPCHDKGSNDNVPATLTHDMDGLPRVIGNTVDMGPYEAIFVKELTPANNGILKQQGMMGGNLYWDIDQSVNKEQLPLMNYHVRLWDKATPQVASIENTVFNKYTMWVYPAIPFAATYQWQVGVEVNNHIYQSEVATVYVGRENPIYVKPNGTGDGSTWDLALGSVSDALDIANSGDRIWVAAGTYKPSGSGRDAAFKLKPFVELVGGYKDGDMVRNPELNVTILSGDLGTANVDSDNAYHVINNAYTEGTPLIGAVIDGFTITGGNAGSTNGGGMLNTYATPTVRYCKFIGNKAASGGAIANVSSSPAIVNSLLINNTASSKGGAIYSDASSAPVIVNSTIANNIATSGGGITGSGTVGNTILYDNTGGQIEGTPTVTYSCVQGGFTGTANIDASPRFKDADNGNYAIGPFSSCFDKGNSELITTDFATSDLSFGEMRNFVSSVDIGAYELSYPDIAARVEVTQATPANAAIDIDYSAPIVLTFNEPATISDPLGITMASGIAFKSISLSDDKKTLTLTPDVNWPFHSSQKLVIANGAILFADNSNFRMVDYECGFDIRSCVPATLSIELLKPETCPGTLAQLTAITTGDVQDYQWLFKETIVATGTPAFAVQKLTADSTGVYYCNVMDMCGNTVSAQSTVEFVEGILNPVIVKKWNDVYLVDNSSKRFSDYQWYTNDVASESGSQYITVINPSVGQSLYVTALDSYTGCIATSDKTTISLTAKSVSVYPNPVASSQPVEIQLPTTATDTKVRLFDASGNLKVEESISGVDHYSFDKTNFVSGVYFMEIVEAEEKTIVKLIIQ